MPSDDLALAHLMGIELKAGRPNGQPLQQRLALDERQAGGISTVEMEKIEGVIDEADATVAVAG